MYILYDQENETCSEPCNTIDECFNSLLEIGCLDKFGVTYKVIDLNENSITELTLSFDRN